MSERRKILESFEKQADFLNTTVAYGIETNRKGNATLIVTDTDGKPIRGAKVTVKQKNHEFRFGANLFMLDELETAEKNESYKKAFADLFNMATLPFYWNATEPERGHTRYAKDSEKIYRRPPIDLCIDFCEKHGIEPREHALAYERFFPKWLKNASIYEVKLAFENRCREIAERYKDKIPTIEVTNEMLWGDHDGVTAFYNEPDYIEWCFKTAEKYFPANQLCINEYSGPAWDDRVRVTNVYYSYIENAIRKGARIDAVGMQYHMFYRAEEEYAQTRPYYDPKNLYAHMDLFSRFGKPLQVTEVTVPAYTANTEDEQLQAEIIRNLYRIWFSHKNMEQIIYWNLVDGYAYGAVPGDMAYGENYFYGGLLRFNLSPKPAYYAIKDLIFNEWHTESSLIADDGGVASFRGFYGDYDVVVEANGKKSEQTLSLRSKGDNRFTVEI